MTCGKIRSSSFCEQRNWPRLLLIATEGHIKFLDQVPTGTFFVEEMINTVFAKKMTMTGRYSAGGERVGVTILSVPKTVVKDLRTQDKHGYNAIRVEVLLPKDKKVIKEIRTDEVIDVGTEIKLEEIIKPGDKVNITGISKGKGFAGVVKRHHFSGGPRTHGQSDRERAPGSSGATTTPGRVFKGTRRGGHMGNEQVMVKKLKVLDVDVEKGVLTVCGAVPGFPRNRKLLVVEKI